MTYKKNIYLAKELYADGDRNQHGMLFDMILRDWIKEKSLHNNLPFYEFIIRPALDEEKPNAICFEFKEREK